MLRAGVAPITKGRFKDEGTDRHGEHHESTGDRRRRGLVLPAGDDDLDLSDVVAVLERRREAADALLLGRAVSRRCVDTWPLQTDDPTGIACCLDCVSKYVVSRTLGVRSGSTPRCSPAACPTRSRHFKVPAGKDIVTTGSITLVRDLIAAGLVDEYRLFVYPVVVGRGQRLFADATEVPECCAWRKLSPFGPASFSCATGRFDGGSTPAPSRGAPPTMTRLPSGSATAAGSRSVARRGQRITGVGSTCARLDVDRSPTPCSLVRLLQGASMYAVWTTTLLLRETPRKSDVVR